MATKRYARTQCVNLLYAHCLGNTNIRDYALSILDDKKVRGSKAKFALELFDGVLGNIEFIDEEIKPHLRSFTVERIAVIDRCILRLGVYEIRLLLSVPQVIISEYISIARNIGGTSPRFINALLDSYFKNLKGVQ